MPPQASIALSTTVRRESGSSSARGSGSPATTTHATPALAGGRPVEQQSVMLFGGTAGASAVQHVACAMIDGVVQHDADDTIVAAGTSVATRCSSAASTASSRSLRLAHASSWAGVWQQHFLKHWSADTQPQGLSRQGNGRARSFAARSRSPTGSDRP